MRLQNQLISKKQVSERTNLSPSTMWRLMQKGMFPESVKISPNRVAWRESDINAWIESKLNSTQSTEK